MQVVVDGLLTNYEKAGTGPVVLLLHGWGDTLKTFSDLRRILAATHTTIALDLPGFGGSDAPKETFNLEKYARFAGLFLDKIGEDPSVIIAHSNGGAIAVKGLSTGVLSCDKLILLASSGVRSAYKARKKALRLAAKTAKVPTKLLPKNAQQKLKRRAYATIGSDLFVAEHLQDTFKEVVREDVIELSSAVNQPTLLIYGSEDSATPPEYGERFEKAMPHADLQVIDGAEHFFHHTHGVDVEALVLKFLEVA